MKKHIVFQPIALCRMALVGVLLLFSACSTNDNGIQKEEKARAITFRNLAVNIDNCQFRDIDDKGFIRISNKEQLEKHVSCDEIPWTVDFDKEFVLIGKLNLPGYPSTLTAQELEIRAGKLTCILNVDMGIAAQPSTVYFVNALPKKYRKMAIELPPQIN